MLLHGDLTERILASFYSVYARLGFGFLESVYANTLANEFDRRGIQYRREVLIEVWDLGQRVGHFRADFLVEDLVIVENEATRTIADIDCAQLLNYLKGTRFEVGLLLNYGEMPTFRRFIFTNERKSTRDGPTARP
jgi:GxxExxY protein